MIDISSMNFSDNIHLTKTEFISLSSLYLNMTVHLVYIMIYVSPFVSTETGDSILI